MLHLHDRATMAHALTLDLDPRLHSLLSKRIAALRTTYGDLTDFTEFLIVEADDTEDDIVRNIGFSPLIEPITGARYGESGFEPGWEYLADRGGWFEMIVTFGSTFAYVLFIADDDSACSELTALCWNFALP